MAKITKVLSLLLLLSACSNLEKSEDERIRKKNAKGEYIQRFHDEYHYDIDDPKVRPREKYPWE